VKVAVLITVHNRREKTLRSLRSLMAQWPEQHSVRVVLVDDGSTDGTAKAVMGEFPELHVVRANGDLFWCRGMALAWTAAAEMDNFDGVLWLNDDVVLDDGSVAAMLDAAEHGRASSQPAILVGATRDPYTNATTYGGLRLVSRWHPGKHERLEPDGTLQPIDTFNGNVVFVPAEVEQQIGRISDHFSHATGDTEYGLRARRAGISVLLLPSHVGVCQRNVPFEHTLRSSLGPKGLPWSDWLFVCRRYTRYGLWPIAFLGPYIRIGRAQAVKKLSSLRAIRTVARETTR
jgi:GT2 family glycosyltransferase